MTTVCVVLPKQGLISQPSAILFRVCVVVVAYQRYLVHARHRDRRCPHLEEKHVTVSFPTQRNGMITNTNWYTLSLRTFELFNGEFEIMHAFSCEYVTYLDTILLFDMKCDHNTI